MENKLFLQALEEVFEERLETEILSLPVTEHVFSERHIGKMRRLMKRSRQPRYGDLSFRKRIAVIILAAVLMLTACTYGTKAVRKVLEDFTTLTEHDGLSTLTLNDRSFESCPETLEAIYGFEAVPEGYVLAFDDECSNAHNLTYSRPEDCSLISLDQWTKSTFRYCIDRSIDKEYLLEDSDGFTCKVLELNYADEQKPGLRSRVFIWEKDDYAFSLHCDSLDNDEMLRLCKSTKIIR